VRIDDADRPETGRDPAARLAAERAAATAQLEALDRQLAGLAEQQALTTHDDEHDPEGVTIGFERAQLLGLRSAARRTVDAVDRAVRRLAEATYGRCLRCGNAIPAERLDALPATETCVGCASRRR
jgi:DnaK suppressor protein